MVCDGLVELPCGVNLLLVKVTAETATILAANGFVIEDRGDVEVKGKGKLQTSYVLQ